MRGFLTNVSAAVRMVWLALVAHLVLWPGIAGAESEALMEQYNQYKALNEQGKYDEGLPFARRALELGEDEFGPDHPTTAILLNNLAELYRAQGRCWRKLSASPSWRGRRAPVRRFHEWARGSRLAAMLLRKLSDDAKTPWNVGSGSMLSY